MTEEQKRFIKPILDAVKSDDIREFGYELVDKLPSYIWEVGASSTGKYHPAYTLGACGLMKHQVAVVRFLNFFFELEQYQNEFTERERDLLRVAALVHDGRKSGNQESYEKSKFTKFDHPLQMAEEIMSYSGKNYLPDNELIYISDAIRSHMGQWNTDKRSKTELPKPSTRPQELIHLADYLASRKCLDMDFSNYEIPEIKIELPDIETFQINWGKKYPKDTLLKDIYAKDPGYVKWIAESEYAREPLKSMAKMLVGKGE